MTQPAPASLLTIFGATGDLARRMLLPSLYSLQAERLLPDGMRILGTARSALDTVACDTPARWAMSIKVARVFLPLRRGSCIAGL